MVQTCLCAGNNLQRRFHRRGGAVKHVQACLNARKDGESGIHNCGGLLSARKDGESGFHNCGGLVKLVQACLCVGNTIPRRLHR